MLAPSVRPPTRRVSADGGFGALRRLPVSLDSIGLFQLIFACSVLPVPSDSDPFRQKSAVLQFASSTGRTATVVFGRSGAEVVMSRRPNQCPANADKLYRIERGLAQWSSQSTFHCRSLPCRMCNCSGLIVAVIIHKNRLHTCRIRTEGLDHKADEEFSCQTPAGPGQSIYSVLILLGDKSGPRPGLLTGWFLSITRKVNT